MESGAINNIKRKWSKDKTQKQKYCSKVTPAVGYINILSLFVNSFNICAFVCLSAPRALFHVPAKGQLVN